MVGEFQPAGGGVARGVSVLAKELAGRGVETLVFSLGPTDKVEGLEVRALPRSFRGARALWKELARGAFDIIHYHVYSSFVPSVAVPGAALSHARRVMTPHFHAVGSFPRVARAAFDRSFGLGTLRASHQIQVDTDIERDNIASEFGLDADRFAVIPPPLAPFLAGLAPPAMRDFDHAPFRLLFVGRLDPQKGLESILEAVATLESRLSRRLHLSVVGADYQGLMPNYKAKASKLANTAVEFLGSISDPELLELYDRSDALVLASRYEAFGMVLMEAQSRGLPVIATNVGGIRRVVSDGETGLLVPYGDVAALADAIGRLAEDADLARKLSRAGPAAVTPYLPAAVAGLELEAYRRTLGN